MPWRVPFRLRSPNSEHHTVVGRGMRASGGFMEGMARAFFNPLRGCFFGGCFTPGCYPGLLLWVPFGDRCMEVYCDLGVYRCLNDFVSIVVQLARLDWNYCNAEVGAL